MEQWAFPSPDSWHLGVKLAEQAIPTGITFPAILNLRFFCLQSLSLPICVSPLFISGVTVPFSWFKEHGKCSKVEDWQDWETTGINFQ